MPQRAFACLVLLTSTGFAAAATSANPLGVDYTEWFNAATQMATDSSGALYLSAYYTLPSGMSASSVTKLSPDGTSILWQNPLGFRVTTMAVSPSGDVFVIPATQLPADTSVSVAKLAAGGSGVAWTAAAGFSLIGETLPVLVADSQGRAYLAAPSATNGTNSVGTVVRINSGGSSIDYTANLTGIPTSIAADGTGAAVVAGNFNDDGSAAGFVARVAADGSAGYYTVLPQDGAPTALVLDSSGNAVVFGSGLLQRLNSTGAVTVSTSVLVGYSLGMDAAGNAYVLGLIGQLYPVRNNIATCQPLPLPGLLPTPTTVGTVPILTVVAPDGSVPQITYLPGVAWSSNVFPVLLLAVGPNSTVFVATSPASGFVPTQQGPFSQVLYPQSNVLLHLSPQSAPKTMSLACVGNAATYWIYPFAPGEMVTLTGRGLGPMQGIQTQATPQSPFPAQASGMQVTFDGTPAPLLWVQDSQINAIAPWSLTPGTNTEICVSSGDTKTNCLTWPVAQTAPGVFTVDGVHAWALNQDGSINTATNPAPPGSIVSVFATGLGPIDPPQTDGALVGSPLPSNVVQTGVEAQSLMPSPPFGSRVISTPASVSYAGPAPYNVAGASQINFLIPSPNYDINFCLVLPGPNLTNITSQFFEIWVVGQ